MSVRDEVGALVGFSRKATVRGPEPILSPISKTIAQPESNAVASDLVLVSETQPFAVR